MTDPTMDSKPSSNEMNFRPASTNSLFSLVYQLTNEQHYHALQLVILISGNNSLIRMTLTCTSNLQQKY